MPKHLDLQGKRFGRLLVLSEYGCTKQNKTRWLVKCDCGIEKVVVGSSLVQGLTCSCGCYSRDKSVLNSVDLHNKRFGKLVVIEKTTARKDRRVIWKCQCDCGNVTHVSSSKLLQGNTKSCGCYRSEANRTHGMTNTREYRHSADRKRRDREQLKDSMWSFALEKALHESQPACVICGSTDRLAVDHVLPLSAGNGLFAGNVVILCKHHNSVKHNKSLQKLSIEWQADLIWNAFRFKDYWESCT